MRSRLPRLGRGVAHCRFVEALLLIAVTVSGWRTAKTAGAIPVAVVVTLAGPVTAVATRTADANGRTGLDERSHLIGLLLRDPLVFDERRELF